MIRRPPRSTLFPHDALPISVLPQPNRPVRHHGGDPMTPTPVVSNRDRKSTRLNSSHITISYAVFCLKKKNNHNNKLIKNKPNEDKRRHTPDTAIQHVNKAHR